MLDVTVEKIGEMLAECEVVGRAGIKLARGRGRIGQK